MPQDFFALFKNILGRITSIKKASISIIDLSLNSIKLLTVKNTNSGVVVEHAFCVDIVAKDDQEYETFLTMQMRKWKKQGVTSQHVYVNISVPYTTTSRVELPKMPTKEIKDALKWLVKDQVSFNVESAVFDYEIISEIVDEEGNNKLEILYTAVEQEKITDVYNVFKKMDYTLIGINVMPFSVLNLLEAGNYFKQNEENIIVLDFGSELTHICIYRDKKLIFTRDIPIGSKRLTEVLIEEDDGHEKLSFSDAEDIKKKYGVPSEMGVILDGKVEAEKTYYLMKPILILLANEIVRSLDYLKSHYSEKAQKYKLYFIGGGSQLKNLRAFIQKEAFLDVEVLNLPTRVNISNIPISQEEFLSIYANALSGAFSYNKKFNLLPDNLKVHNIYTYEKISLRLLFLFFNLFFIVSIWMNNVQIQALKNNIKIFQFSRNELQSFMDKKQKIAMYKNLLDNILTKKTPVYLVLLQLSNSIPENIVVSDILFEQQQSKLTMRGFVLTEPENTQNILNEFISSLSKSLLFKEVSLDYVKTAGLDKTAGQEFKLECQTNEGVGYDLVVKNQ